MSMVWGISFIQAVITTHPNSMLIPKSTRDVQSPPNKISPLLSALYFYRKRTNISGFDALPYLNHHHSPHARYELELQFWGLSSPLTTRLSYRQNLCTQQTLISNFSNQVDQSRTVWTTSHTQVSGPRLEELINLCINIIYREVGRTRKGLQDWGRQFFLWAHARC